MEAKSDIVVLLGAGFSKAVSTNMPLVAELYERVLDRLYPENPLVRLLRRYEANEFEQALSYLAVDSPWKSKEAYYRDLSQFFELIRRIHEQIRCSEATIFDGFRPVLPEWAKRLIGHFHAQQVTS